MEWLTRTTTQWLISLAIGVVRSIVFTDMSASPCLKITLSPSFNYHLIDSDVLIYMCSFTVSFVSIIMSALIFLFVWSNSCLYWRSRTPLKTIRCWPIIRSVLDWRAFCVCILLLPPCTILQPFSDQWHW